MSTVAGIYIDASGKSHLVDNVGTKPAGVPDAFFEELKKYTLCGLDFDKAHRGPAAGADLEKLINTAVEANTTAREKANADYDTAKKAAEAKAKDAKADAQKAEHTANAAADQAFADTQKAINNGTGQFVGHNPAQKNADHQQAKKDKQTAKEAAHKKKNAADDAADAKKKGEIDAAAAARDAALKAIPAPALTCAPKGDCAGKTCKTAYIYKPGIGGGPTVKAKAADIKYYEADVLYFCTCDPKL